jgi:hypothetical protein
MSKKPEVIIRTKGSPLTEDDFEGEAPVGTWKKSASPESQRRFQNWLDHIKSELDK